MKKDKSIFSRKRKYIAVVVSKKNDKTVKAQIENWHFHPLYKKRIKQVKNLVIHDEKNESNVGDRIQIIESKPLSKSKKWRLVKIIEKAK